MAYTVQEGSSRRRYDVAAPSPAPMSTIETGTASSSSSSLSPPPPSSAASPARSALPSPAPSPPLLASPASAPASAMPLRVFRLAFHFCRLAISAWMGASTCDSTRWCSSPKKALSVCPGPATAATSAGRSGLADGKSSIEKSDSLSGGRRAGGPVRTPVGFAGCAAAAGGADAAKADADAGAGVGAFTGAAAAAEPELDVCPAAPASCMPSRCMRFDGGGAAAASSTSSPTAGRRETGFAGEATAACVGFSARLSQVAKFS